MSTFVLRDFSAQHSGGSIGDCRPRGSDAASFRAASSSLPISLALAGRMRLDLRTA